MTDDTNEFKDLYVPDASAMAEKDIKHWSRYMAHRKFNTEQEAREEMFRMLQHSDKQSWAPIFGKWGDAKNRWSADSVPIYRDRWGYFRVGRPMNYYKYPRKQGDTTPRGPKPVWPRPPVQEYLSNNTSDFSDGTNGEPSAPASYAGDGGTNVGLPDYKYLERKKARHEKLRALLQRRDLTHRSRVDWDTRASAGMRESADDDSELLKDMSELAPVLHPSSTSPDYYQVSLGDKWIGTVYRENSAIYPRVPTLRKLHQMYPWVGRYNMLVARFKTLELAVAHLVAQSNHEPVHPSGDDYARTMRRTPLGQMPVDTEESMPTRADQIVKSLLEA